MLAGITHHEEQQDEELTQQKLEIGTLKQKLAELEKIKDSSQEHLATYRTCYNCYKRGHIAKECWTDMARANQPYNYHN